MKSKETKDKVREELAKSIAEQIHDSIKEISDKTAERVVEIWLEFRRAHAKVVELADRQDGFKRFLETVKADDMPRLDEIVALVLAGEGEPGVLKRLDDGTLHRAVTGLPPGSLEIAREARSLETALQWSAVAGDSLPKVVEYEVHRRAKPEDFTKASLQRLLGLEDRLAVTRLASLTPAARTPLFELETAELKSLARVLDETQLDSLSRYLTSLDKASAQRVLRAVAQTPARMAELGKPSVRDAILASSDQAAAVGMMLQASSMPDPNLMMEHLRLVLDGRVSPLLLWEKHPATLVGDALPGARPAAHDEAAAVRHAPEDRRAAAGRPRRPPLMRLVTSETVPDRPIEQGEMVYACAVSGANILRDMREAVINTIGGHMTKYEALLDQTIARALDVLSERARRAGLRRRARHPHLPPHHHQRRHRGGRGRHRVQVSGARDRRVESFGTERNRSPMHGVSSRCLPPGSRHPLAPEQAESGSQREGALVRASDLRCPRFTHNAFAAPPCHVRALAAISRAGWHLRCRVVAGLGSQGHRGRTNLWL